MEYVMPDGKTVKIITLTELLALFAKEYGGDKLIRVSCEPDEVVQEKAAAKKLEELWCFYAVNCDEKVVGEIGRIDRKFFHIWFVYHQAYKIWQPFIEQEPKLGLNLAGYKEIGKVMVPISRIGGADGVDMVLTEVSTDPLGRRYVTLAARSESNPAKPGDGKGDRLIGYGVSDPNRINASGKVGYYARWLEPSALTPSERDRLMPLGAFVKICEDGRARSAVLGLYEFGPLRPEFRPPSSTPTTA